MVSKKVVIVQRQASIHNLRAMQVFHKFGLKIIYDLDDNLWSLPHGNPAKREFEAHQEGFAMCSREADLLTVSTQGLKTAAGMALPTDKEILIIPNAIDFKLFNKKEIERDDNLVVIGWGGSNTHNDDVKDVFNLLPKVLSKCPQAVMEVVGAPPMKEATQSVKVLKILEREEEIQVKDSKVKKMMPYALLIEDVKTGQREEVPWREFKNVNKALLGKVMTRQVLVQGDLAKHPQYRFKLWSPIREYHNRFSSWAWDIAIAPLEDYRFNKSKSAIKMLEAASQQVPCLVSDVQPYAEFCALGGDDLKWLLCSKIEEWESKLIALIQEPARRQHLGMKMYEVAKKYFDIEVVRNNWQHAFSEALKV